MMLAKPSEPIIDIVAPDGTRHRAGQKYSPTFDGAHAEAKELHGLTDYTLDVVEYTQPQPYQWGPYHLD